MGRTNLDKAYSMLNRLQFIQALALAAQHEVDNDYKIMDYVDATQDLVNQLQVALDAIERELAS